MKYIIIGGVAAGASAVAQIARYQKEAEIRLYDKSAYISYSACGMPYYLGRVTEEFDDIVPRTEEDFKEKYGTDVYYRHEVTKIDPTKKEVTVKDLAAGTTFTDKYDKLLIATGASPKIPKIKGGDKENVFVLRTVDDMLAIDSFIHNAKVKKVAIIGSGMIGLEMAENFIARGLEVTIVNRSDKIGPKLSDLLAERVEEELLKHGVNILKEATTAEIFDDYLLMEDGREVEAEMVLLTTGVKPNVELAEDAGIELGETGAIKVDLSMQTNIDSIYAAGDCCEQNNIILDKPTYSPLGTTSNKQGLVAGANMVGVPFRHSGSLGTGIVKVFDLTIGKIGLSKKQAEAEGFDPVIIDVDKKSNADYFEFGTITINAMADRKTKKLLGAQLVGEKDVDKRLDVLAAAMTYGAVVEDFVQMDISYAPPYNSVRDPLMVMGLQLLSEIENV